MRTPIVIAAIVAAHCAAVGGIFLIQGCGTPVPELPAAGTPAMPVLPDEPVHVRRVLQPVQPIQPIASAKTWPVGETTTYVVRKGDTLSHVASRYGLSVNEVIAINALKDPNRVRVGQKLILPGKHNVDVVRPAPRTPSAPAKPVKIPLGGEYVVKTGDSLSVIAARTGTTVKKLKQANNLKSDMIMVGQKLKLPTGGSLKATGGQSSERAPEIDVPDQRPVPGVGIMEKVPDPTPGRLPTHGEAPAGVAQGDPNASHEVHVVKDEQEDAYSVAIWWGVSPEALMELNGLTSPELKKGQSLKIPVQTE